MWDKPVVAATAKPTVASLSSNTAPQTATAIFTGDGDGSIFKLKDGASVDCRVYGIDAPEVPHGNKQGQPHGDKSKNWLKDKILNKEVTLTITQPVLDPSAKPTPQNNYNRALCKIELSGADISTAAVKDGMAWVYDYFIKGKPEEAGLKAAQKEAKDSKKGLWSDPNPEYPPDFKRRIKNIPY